MKANRSDLTPEAFILYSSDSITSILGYEPDEIVNRSAWDFFPEEELPRAKIFHQRRIVTDKAAVLAYCRIQNKAGRWIGCECCFTIVYDIMVVCTSVYHEGGNSDGKFTSEACEPKSSSSHTSQAER
jgi:PAS domain S-box-containing protein